jgi:pimeloyl-ACP methyl ester carboxylesterase
MTNMMNSIPAARAQGATGWRRRRRSVVLWIAVLGVVLTSTLLVAGQIAKARLHSQHPPIGQLVDIGGYRLHLSCQGSGGPTVILESGSGVPGLNWALVQPEVVQQTRVCWYDRAGLGWSDPSPHPRTVAVMAEELHTLLARAGIDGPYVLVGHSLGGVIIRQFALAHPHDVVGMVLVDSATEQQNTRFPEAINASLASAPTLLRLMSVAGDAGLLALYPGIFPLPTQLPADTAATFQALVVSSGKLFRTSLAELVAMDTDPARRPAALGDIPLVVLRHSRTVPPIKGDVTPEVAQAYEAIWAQMQDELAALSPQGRVVVAEESGHSIQLDRPDVVIAAIQDVLAATR